MAHAGQAIEAEAVAECIRDTIDQFLEDHWNMEAADVEVGRDMFGPSFNVNINGFWFKVTVKEAE